MNVLFISDNFSAGGLETHLITYFKYLKKLNWRIYFMSSFSQDTKPFSGVDLYTDKLFNLEISNYSAASVLKFYEKTKDIIKHYKIDFVHLHPFISLYGGFTAAFEEGIPVVTTLHGKLSLFSPDDSSNLFLENVILKNSVVFSVNEALYKELKDSCDNIYYLPNPVDDTIFKPCSDKKENYVLIVGRLDEDKFEGIKSALSILLELSKEMGFKIKVVGDGRKKEKLTTLFKDNNIEFLGYKPSEDVAQLMSKAKAVGGMGRVVLEALFTKTPVFLIGYENIKGFLTEELFKEAKKSNFNGNNIGKTDLNVFIKQLKDVLLSNNENFSGLYEAVFKEYSSSSIVSKYVEIIEKIGTLRQDRDSMDFYRNASVLYKDFLFKKSELEKLTEEFNKTTVKLNRLSEQSEKIIKELTENLNNSTEKLNLLFEQNEQLQKEKRELYSQLVNEKKKLNDIYSSRFWKMASKFYTTRDRLKQLVSKKNNYAALPSQNEERERQHRYFEKYFENPSKKEVQRVRDLLDSSDYKGIVVYPLSYPMHIKQRPEHILSELTKEGYLVLILSLSPVEYSIKKIGKNIFITDLSAAAVYLLRDEKVVLYITFYGFYYFTELFRRAVLVYDVLDEPSLMSDFSDSSLKNHKRLMQSADICLFSSENLYEKYGKDASNPMLLKNGVSVDDFKLDTSEKKFKKISKKDGEIVVGFYGAVSELLDFDILEDVLEVENVKLLLIGPKTPFSAENEQLLEERFNRLMKFKNFEYVEFVPYEELKYYLNDFDICIIPFIVNDTTDSVCPLKLFEFMAADKPIVCSATRELLRFKEYIYVANSKEEFKEKIRELVKNGFGETNYLKIIEEYRWENLIKPLVEQLKALEGEKRVAVVENRKIVDILNINFFDWKGETPYYGGAERYVIDLANLIEKMGYGVRIVQNAYSYFEKEYKGLKVVGIPAQSGWDYEKLYSYYLKKFEHSSYTICSPLDIACKSSSNSVIGINHGIYWDETSNRFDKISSNRHRKILNAVNNVDVGVCVDTNFINWVRTYDYELSNKLIYIPNYFDPSQFKKYDKEFSNDEIVILYPRRLYAPRGFYLSLEVLDSIIPTIDNVKFRFVGQADEKEQNMINKYIKKYPGKVEHQVLSTKEMELAYKDSQIVIIPTIHSEGTSLSCIEAMATNNAIISTNVGGLPNLIIDGYNGMLIHPKKEELRNSLLYLIDNPNKRQELAINALNVVKAFGKEKWEEKWTNILHSFLS